MLEYVLLLLETLIHSKFQSPKNAPSAILVTLSGIEILSADMYSSSKSPQKAVEAIISTP